MITEDGWPHRSSDPVDPSTITDPGPRLDVGHVVAPDIRDLLLEFESVGYSCEFGLVQRRYEAEPLGLLRWAQTFPDMLITLLDAEFKGFGSAEQTTLDVMEWGELIMHDRHYNCMMHTFTQHDAVDREVFFKSQCRRLQFLADKLRQQLIDVEKVVVYHAPDLTDDKARDILRTLKAYGDNKLLIARTATDGSPAGTVSDRGDGLFEGFLAHFGKAPGGHVWDIDFESWVAICQKTRALMR